MRQWTSGWALALALAGCDEGVRFDDSIDLELDFRTSDADGELHMPYALGATMRVFAAHDGGGAAMQGLRLQSSDPGVLELVPADAMVDERIAADAVAVGRGVADVWLVDEHDDVVASAEIEVRAPTRAVLHAAAPQFVQRDDANAIAGTPAVLAEGTAMFEVRLYDGATRLHGSGGLSAHGGDGVDAAMVPTWFDEGRDWLRVIPSRLGTHEITLSANGEPFASTTVAAVAAEEIAEVRLRGEEPRSSGDGEWVPLAAQAVDGRNQPIHGVPYAWALSGTSVDLGAELFRYRIDRSHRRTLTASFGAHVVSATIHAAEP